MKWWTKSEAKSLPKGIKKSSELLQILILSLFMTGGFFALLSLILIFLLPQKVEATKAQAADLQELQKLLGEKSELRKTRDQVNEFKKAGGDINLRSIMEQNLSDLVTASLPEIVARPLKGKTMEYSQTVKLKTAGLQSLINFIARVKQSQNSIRVGTLNFSRNRRANVKDAWDSSLVFFHYNNKEVLAKLGTPPAGQTPPKAAPSTAPEKPGTPAGEESPTESPPKAATPASKPSASAPPESAPSDDSEKTPAPAAGEEDE